MRFLWDQFHSDYRQMSNASIICEDGVIFTHKLMLANISKLLKLILSEIPAADEVTIYLHNFPKKHVEEFFLELLQKKESSYGQLCSTFGIQSHSHSVKKEIGKISDVEIKEENDFFDSEALLHEHQESMETDIHNDNVTKVKVKEIEEERVKNQKSKRDIDEDVERVSEETIKELEKDLIINPSSKRELLLNKTINKKIKYERGIAFFKSGRATSIRHAAKAHGLNDKTLKKLLLNCGSFQGPGSYKKLTRFSKEEEKIIVNRALTLSSSEENSLTFKRLREVIREEAEVVKINQPERSTEMTFTDKSLYTFAYTLAERNGILDLCHSHMRRSRDTRRTYECEICYNSFTFKNSLVSHQKKCHSFLNQ